MSSTRKLPRCVASLSAGVLASAGMLSGCQRVQQTPPDTLNDSPLLVDEAMQIRDWDRSTAYYASGAVEAGAPRVTFEPKYGTERVESTDPRTGETIVRQERTGDAYSNTVVDPAIGVGNFVLIPFTYFWTPPFKTIVSRGAVVPPTHTAMPEVRIIE